MKFSIKAFFSKCDQIRRKLRIWSHLLKKFVMENFIFCAMRVLQWDSLSPLLFNLIVNTLINNVKSEKVECIGYVYQGCLSPKHWFQFTHSENWEKNNQLLCNIFIKRTTWANLSFVLINAIRSALNVKCQ